MSAQLIELSQSELRIAVLEDRAQSGRSVLAGLEKLRDADVLDMRAFSFADTVIYRVLYRVKTDELRSVIVAASTGEPVMEESPLGQVILACAQSVEILENGVLDIPAD